MEQKEAVTLYLSMQLDDDDGVVYAFKMDSVVTDPEAALRRAVQDYLQSAEGQKAQEENYGFNWGDAMHIPDSFYQKQGLTPVWNRSIDVFVDHDEDLTGTE